MSDERRREAGDSRLDAAIDGAVRQMLDVDPPAGLRGRVQRRIAARDDGAAVASPFTRKILWTSLPVAAAAVLAFMVLGPSSTPPPPAVPGTVVVALPPAPIDTGRPRLETLPKPAAPRPAAGTARRVPPAATPERMIAAVVLETEDSTFAVPPLDVPEALTIRELVTPPTAPLPSTAPEPMQIQSLEISALPELPHERRKE